MIAYLVCAEDATGFSDCEERGWQRIALNRFVTEERDDIRVISRIQQLVPFAGQTAMIKGSDYENGPDGEVALMRWIGGGNGQRGEKERFDEFVATGSGAWFDIDKLHEVRQTQTDVSSSF